jgi:hypothetical protein
METNLLDDMVLKAEVTEEEEEEEDILLFYYYIIYHCILQFRN